MLHFDIIMLNGDINKSHENMLIQTILHVGDRSIRMPPVYNLQI